jgi:hypothetical protein
VRGEPCVGAETWEEGSVEVAGEPAGRKPTGLLGKGKGCWGQNSSQKLQIQAKMKA